MDKSKHNLRSIVALLFIAFSSFTVFAQKNTSNSQTTTNNNISTKGGEAQITGNNNPINSRLHTKLQGTDIFQVRNSISRESTSDPGSTGTYNTGLGDGNTSQNSNTSSCPKMYTEVRIPFLQSCVSSVAHVDYCNDGTALAIGVYVDVQFPIELTLDSASLPYTIVGTDLYRFQLGNVIAGDCNVFDLHFTTACDSNLLGEEHCINAHIYPDTICQAVSTDHLLSVNGSCNNGTAKFTIQNHGVTITSVQNVQLIAIEDHLLAGNPPNYLLRDTLEIGKDTTEGYGFGLGSGGNGTVTDYKLTIKDQFGMLLATSQVKNCSASLTNPTVSNFHPNQFSNGTHLPFLAHGCAINGAASVSSSSTASQSFNKNNSSSTGSNINNQRTTKNSLQIEEETIVHVFPNPFDQFATVKIDGPIGNQFSFRLYDVTGKTVQFLNLSEQKEFRIDRRDLLSGMYFYQIESEGDLIGSGKVIIK